MATSFIYDASGRRKYLDHSERQAFLKAAENANPEIHTFCTVLAYTGARPTEIRNLTPRRIDFGAKVIVLECLKKEKRGIFRAVPIPQRVLQKLDKIHAIRRAQQSNHSADKRIWSWSRTTAWRNVHEVMCSAGITGPQATAKGLRHSLGVLGLQASVPLPTLQKWLGHTRLRTTALYADATGPEERKYAKQYWRKF